MLNPTRSEDTFVNVILCECVHERFRFRYCVQHVTGYWKYVTLRQIDTLEKINLKLEGCFSFLPKFTLKTKIIFFWYNLMKVKKLAISHNNDYYLIHFSIYFSIK
ncbi:hypothetical protein BpHYR1_031130 [Brachionus plicatilis]|uniref:Uncharacterized protein n=1 Tax=Brachionus plicatilis TaxID=10195 RepID=A0A3M7SJ26_BRAPC|nr:hypothetical protein BpHYR1_031130 [Brachionus plicatilis]